MIRRVTVTTFALLYAVTLFCSTVEKTSTWTAKTAETEATGFRLTGSSPSVQAQKNFTPHHPNRRILEDPFLIGSPETVAGIVMPEIRRTDHFSSFTVHNPALRQTGSRAPPFRS